MVLSYILIGFLGLVFGSFAGATVWRLRARQLVQDTKDGQAIDKAELKKLKPLTKARVKNDRSRCLHCGHELSPRDLIPLVSWLGTKGKCRYCGKSIGRFEPLIELGTAASFLILFHSWLANFSLSLTGVILLVGGLVTVVLLAILFAYDTKWFILPDVVVWPLIVLGLAYATYSVVLADNQLVTVASIAVSVLILSGLYLALWLYSKGSWVGFGDVKLGLGLGLLLVDWRLAFLALFLANFIGTLVVLPGILKRTVGRQTQVPFGPLLIAGFAISALFGNQLIGLYERASIWLVAVTLMV